MDATDEGTEQNGGGPSGAKATKTQPQASQKQQQQPRPRPKVTENVPKTLSKASCLVAKRMSPALHLLLFEQSM